MPRLNDPVHYVSYGSADGTYPSTCRAAIVTGVPGPAGLPDERVDLFVMNPTGVFLNRCPRDESVADDGSRAGGTWHSLNCPN